MGAVILLNPVVVAAWPAFSSAVVSAATTLGYTQLKAIAELQGSARTEVKGVELEVANSTVVTDQLGRDQKIAVTRAGVTVTFRRDERGKASLSVIGDGHTDDELRALGQELSKRVVQQYVYQQIRAEADARQFVVVEESTDETNAIRMTVRHWDN